MFKVLVFTRLYAFSAILRVRMNQKMSENKEVFAPYLQAFQRGTALWNVFGNTVALIYFFSTSKII
ncbi:MAG: hypothetical protein ACJATN_000192 [Neolewinella sp.]